MVVVSMSNNFDEIINSIKSKKTKEETEEFLKKSLTPEQNQQLRDVMSDKNALKNLLSTPKAQEILKRFSEEKND